MRLLKFSKSLIMLEPFSTILKIHYEALDSSRRNIRGDYLPKKAQIVLLFLLFIIPALLFFIVVFNDDKLLEEISNRVNSLNGFVGISMPLFVGIFFSLLLAIPDNIRRCRSSDMDSVSKRKQIKGYKQISYIILHLLLVCIYIAICFLFSGLLFCDRILLFYYSSVIFLFSHFIMVIIYLVVRYYYLYQSAM